MYSFYRVPGHSSHKTPEACTHQDITRQLLLTAISASYHTTSHLSTVTGYPTSYHVLPQSETDSMANTRHNVSFVSKPVYPVEKILYSGGRPQMTIWRLCIACWIPKATNTHSQCVTLIDFPLQQWLHERTPLLRYTHIAWLVFSYFFVLQGHSAQPSEYGPAGHSHLSVSMLLTALLYHDKEMGCDYRLEAACWLVE
jgi:hypothetical protein